MSHATDTLNENGKRTYTSAEELVRAVVDEAKQTFAIWKPPASQEVSFKTDKKPVFVNVHALVHRSTLELRAPQVISELSAKEGKTDEDICLSLVEKPVDDEYIVKAAERAIKNMNSNKYKVVAFPPYWQTTQPETKEEVLKVEVVCLSFTKQEWELALLSLDDEEKEVVVFNVVKDDDASVEKDMHPEDFPVGLPAVHAKHAHAHAILVETDAWKTTSDDPIIATPFDLEGFRKDFYADAPDGI